MANISVTGQGATADAYGVSVSSDGSFSFDGAVNKVMGILDSHAPGFVKSIMAAAAEAGAEMVATEGAFATAVAALPAEIGASVAVAGPFIPIAAAVIAVPLILTALDGASGGTGCCGSAPLTEQQATMMVMGFVNFGGGSRFPNNQEMAQIKKLMRFGSCDPAEQQWDAGGWKPANAWERYIGAAIIAAYNESTDCWHNFQTAEYPVVLAAAIGAWNRTHSSSKVVTVSRKVNATIHGSFGGKPYTSYGAPSDQHDPIAIALNYAAVKYRKDGTSNGWAVPRDHYVTFKVNAGPVIKPGTIIPRLKGIGIKPMALPDTIPRLLPIRIAPPRPVQPIDLTQPVSHASIALPPQTSSSLTILGMPAKKIGFIGLGVAALGGVVMLAKKFI